MKRAIYKGEEVYLMKILPPPDSDSNPIAVIQHRNGDIDHWSVTKLTMVDTIDWEQRRYQLAKEILSGLLSCDNKPHLLYSQHCKEALDYADEMIKQLKGE